MEKHTRAVLFRKRKDIHENSFIFGETHESSFIRKRKDIRESISISEKKMRSDRAWKVWKQNTHESRLDFANKKYDENSHLEENTQYTRILNTERKGMKN